MPVKPLSNFDLIDISKNNNIHVHVHAIQDLKLIKCKSNGNYIFNINQDGVMGQWVCCCIRNNIVYYFDSFGLPPSNEIMSFCRGKKIYINRNDVQHVDGIECGYYTLAFIHFFLKYRGYKKHVIHAFTSMFFNDTTKNKVVLQTYIKKHFH